MSKSILIVDDDSTILRLFELDILNRNTELIITSAENGEEAIVMIEKNKPDMVVLDIRMPKGDGFSVLNHLQEKSIDVPVLILTNYKNDDYVAKSKTYSNVKDYVVKHETRLDKVFGMIAEELNA